ncbi:dihydrofolate reductase [Metabacillus indicus]|uniref:dihydrofolate reductase n=1 Tax=Metabacillus indicus TaxID=246786 RepID=UPI00317C2F4F
MISMIVAMDENHLIGRKNDLPWRIPADLAYFKKVTLGHPVLMGRKTFESIGKPLPGRENIILTRNKHYSQEGTKVIHELGEVLGDQSLQEKNLFIIGGAEIFKECLHLADRLYITKIHDTFEGDTFFPEFKEENYCVISREKGPKDNKNPYDYEFIVYEK